MNLQGISGFRSLLRYIDKRLEYQNHQKEQGIKPSYFTLQDVDTDGQLSYTTVCKIIRQLLVCGFLERPARGEYYVVKSPINISNSKILELSAKNAVISLRCGLKPITTDYNHKNIQKIRERRK